jgi:hypothetical protein
MGSTHTPVRIRAKLRGMGREADCIVMATEVSRPGFPPKYTKMSIHDEPADLPDGPYEVSWPGYKISKIRQNGSFLGAQA